MSDRRGRRSSRYDDDDYERPPQKRSLSRRALDKLGDAMGSLGLDGGSSSSSRRHRSPSPIHSSRRSRRHRSRDSDYLRDHALERYYPPSSGHNRRYHSSSPSRAPRRSRRARSRSSSTSSSDSSRPGVTRSRSRVMVERGVEAAVKAGAAEAFRLRKEPGPWRGEKGGRVATAAISAGVIGAATEDKHKKGRGGTLGSALGGLVVNRLVNGPRSEVRK